ncbi:MAG: YfhO family protein [Bacteroidota bacterium]
MKNLSFKNIAPHLIAVVVFLIVTFIFCKPALEPGVVLQQGDITAVESMKHQSDLYKEQHGVYPLWITSMFSGMPAYNVMFEGPVSPFTYIDKAMQLWLPKPLNVFFLFSICFYIFCMCVRIRPYVAIFASLAFAYATYNPILVVAGHDTKLLAMAYAPALIGSIIVLFEKQYLKGFILTALFATLHLIQNHQQISYYVFIILGFMTVAYLVRWIKEKDFAHIGKAGAIVTSAAVMAVAINSILILPVYDYAKDSKRGGQLIMDRKGGTNKPATDKNKTTGLSIDYAFQWSNTKSEGLNVMFPGINGYGAYVSQREGEYNIYPRLDDNSAVATYLSEKLNVPGDQVENLVSNISTSLYWGDKPGTTGPAYLGAVVCCLFVLGMFFGDNKHKWWILAASITGIILAMGKSLPSINNFLFEHLPLYNKLRTPEMSMVIPQFLFPMLAVMGVQRIIDGNYTDGAKKLKLTAITMAIIFAVAGALYFSFDYSKENKTRTREFNSIVAVQDSSTNGKLQLLSEKEQPLADNQLYENFVYQAKGDTKIAKDILDALHKDREALLKGDIVRAFIFVLLTLGLIGLFIYKKINNVVLLIALPLLVLFDLVPIGTHYLNEKSFETAGNYKANEFTASPADEKVLQDKDPNYRVFDMSGGDPFQDAKPSYFHKSIGGYHPAKIGIYDDLAAYQLNGNLNTAVLNMLNAKYIIQSTPDRKSKTAYPNPGALGNCWFVKGAKFVNGPAEEMKALDNFEPKDTAVIDNSFKNIVTGFVAPDSAATIKQTSFDNMEIKYESNSSTANLAVFSEVYYRDWKAYIDGKEVPVAKANYVLRALVIPAGKHAINFKFEPKVFNTSYIVSKYANWLLLAILVVFTFMLFKNSSDKKNVDA